MPARLLGLLLLLALSACAPSSGVYHTVLDGQTLYRISRGYGVDENYLARINGISDPTRLQAGDLLYIPGVQQVRDLAPPPPPAKSTPPVKTAPRPSGKVASKAAPPARSGKRPPHKADPVKTAQTPPALLPGAAAAPLAASSTSPPAVVSGRFLWPLRGEVLRRFGGAGATAKGMELGAAANSPIVAAAAGRVIYSGDGIRSYGNLIILKHDESFFTVYGFNERNLVQAGSFVSKGEKIAVIGAPPGGGRSRLYFELRCGKEAVDPTIYLP